MFFPSRLGCPSSDFPLFSSLLTQVSWYNSSPTCHEGHNQSYLSRPGRKWLSYAIQPVRGSRPGKPTKFLCRIPSPRQSIYCFLQHRFLVLLTKTLNHLQVISTISTTVCSVCSMCLRPLLGWWLVGLVWFGLFGQSVGKMAIRLAGSTVKLTRGGSLAV